jgi:hypothetical protein
MKNKSIKIAYWAVLGLITFGMLFSAVPSVLKLPYAVEHFCNVLRLPEYLLVFTGLIKLIGLVVLYIPGYPKLKEWVFAGFTFDLMGAWYCNFSVMNSFSASVPALVFLALIAVLYYLYTKLYVYPTTNSLNKQNI